MTRKQRNRDTDWLSIIDGEWPRVESALSAWLAIDNMDEDGLERLKLASFFAKQ